MTTTINATPTLDKTQYATGDVGTVTIPGATAASVQDITAHLSLNLTADDGTQETLTADVPVTQTKHLGVKLTAISLDGVAGTVAEDGQSATFTAP